MCYKKYPTLQKKLFKEVLHENINPDRGKTGLIRSGIEVKLACVSLLISADIDTNVTVVSHLAA